MRHRSLFLLALFVASSLFMHVSALGYEPETHREIAQRSTSDDVSILDPVLKRELGLPAGRLTPFTNTEGRTLDVREWIGDGAALEDEPELRVFNHFHNPLLPWSEAGLRIVARIGNSSVYWQQRDNQFPRSGNSNWAWADVRKFYHRALEADAPDVREAFFADLFRGLGHLTHTIQDATVPAHTRNDPHLRHEGYEKFLDKLQTAQPPSPLRVRFEELLARVAPRPSFALAARIEDDRAPIPVAHLIDRDIFTGANVDVLTGTGQGLAEYTNGNFVSDDTIFREFVLPRLAAVDPTPIPEVDDNGRTRNYFAKFADGETIDRFIAEGVFTERLLFRGQAFGGHVLGDRVYESYARLLVPRAVGYSGALLDYFFRGKLDVSVQYTDDPRVLQLAGTNASLDALDRGTVAIYAEDGAGTRWPVLDPSSDDVTIVPLGAVAIAPAETGQPIVRRSDARPIRFVPPFTADRFVAVYAGDLGAEQVESPAGFVGGVIGKVFGGARSEALVGDGSRRSLRTTDGVFALPPEVDDLQRFQWGDNDNTFVGLTSVEPNVPAQVKAFRLARPVGSGDVPLSGDDANRVVSLTELKSVNFPFGLDLGVTVQYSETVVFGQGIEAYDVRDVLEYAGQEIDGLPVYRLASHTVSPLRVDPIASDELQFGESIPLVLDREHLDDGSGPSPKPYAWFVKEVGIDAQDRLLAVVQAYMTEPTDATRAVTRLGRGPDGALVPIGTSLVKGMFQIGPVTWAVIDVERGTVLGATAAPTVVTSSAETGGTIVRQKFAHTTFLGGPLAGEKGEWSFAQSIEGVQQPLPGERPPLEATELGDVPDATGRRSLDVQGLLRQDLHALVATSTSFVTITGETEPRVYFLDGIRQGMYVKDDHILHVTAAIPHVYKGTPFRVNESREVGYRTFLRDVKLARPHGPGLVSALALFGRPVGISEGDIGFLVRWTPESQAATAMAMGDIFPTASFQLLFATPDSALLRADTFFDSTTMLVDFPRQEIQYYWGQDLSQQYVLLAPELLYNVEDTQFHTADDSLTRTALPVPLAAAPAQLPPLAAYHLIRRP